MNETQEHTEYVVVALERAGAEALLAGATVGLDDPPEGAVDADAGWEAMRALERTLRGDADAEEIAVEEGLAALDAFFSHDAELIVFDSDGTGVMSADDYGRLHRLSELLRGGRPALDEASFRSRVSRALDAGYEEIQRREAAGDLPFTDERHELYAEAVVREFVPADDERRP